MVITSAHLEARLAQYRQAKDQHARQIDGLDGYIQACEYWLGQVQLPEPDAGSGQLPPPPPVADNVISFPVAPDAPSPA